jgi:hypothetical protein
MNSENCLKGVDPDRVNTNLVNEVIRRYKFSSFEGAESTVIRYVSFYNNERLYSSIDYRLSRETYEWKESIIEKR